jgi:hypothetical protein
MTEDINEIHRLVFSAQGSVTPTGEFEIIAITAGDANGWTFSEACLQESIKLWDNSECFVDHGGFWSGRSIRDLGGVLSKVAWNEEKRGIQAILSTIGPSASIVEEIGRQMLSADPGKRPNIGFSADIQFTAKQRQVQTITRVFSVDLVYKPARGGQFIRALNSEGEPMSEEQVTTPASELETMRNLLQVQTEQARLAQEAEATRAVRLQMCQYLLDSGLSASKLPTPMQEHVRLQFKARVFEPAELTAAIESARELVSSLTGGQAVQGPSGQIHAMYSSEDQLQAAVDDLMGAERRADLKTLQIPRLSGIRELYLMLTGDHDLHGGYYPTRARFATTADFTGLVKNALNKIVTNRWAELGRAGYNWWERIAAQESFSSLNSITGTLVGTVGTLPAVAEGAEYTELAVGDSPETASFTKYGGYIPLTLELIDRDETRKLRAYPRELANAGLRRISSLVAAVFTDNAAVGPTMADGGALFNATVVTTAGGHANLLTTALSAAEWDVVGKAVYNQPMLVKQASGYYGTGPKQALDPKYLLVPRALKLAAYKILYPTMENTAQINSENQQRGEQGDVVVVPEWTDATDWAAACDPILAPAVFVGTRFGIMPEVFIASNELSPAVFMNDEHRLKVRHFVAVWVNDFRGLHKSNVAG